VGITPGETQNWYRFHEWGFARAILNDPKALKNLSLITTHSFAFEDSLDRHFGDYRSTGVNYLRAKKPELHAWVNSMSWGGMDADFIESIRKNIYISQCNGLTPWAVIQRPSQWKGGDPNPRTAFHVTDDGTLKVLPGYYYYKQVTRAGQPGTAVAAVRSLNPRITVMGFASNGTQNPNAFVLINLDEDETDVTINVKGAQTKTFAAYRTGDDEQYAKVGTFTVEDGSFEYDAPGETVTTFFEQ
jgi:O-glycosyl hydrolase